MIKSLTVRYVLPVIFLVFGIALALNVVKYSVLSSEYYRIGSGGMTVKEKIDMAVGFFWQGFTLGLVSDGSDKVANIYAIFAAADCYEKTAARFSWILFGLAVIGMAYLIVSTYIYHQPISGLITGFIGISFLFLLVGLIAPIMSFYVYGDVQLLGRCIQKYESKGILSAAVTLYTSGKWVVALLIIVFSVVTPTIKLLLTLTAMKAPTVAVRRWAIRVIEFIGKWSMADVFIVAMLLAVFSLSATPGSSEGSDAQVGNGLYYFAGYCILSLIAGHLLI
ncbi:MAG: paraquat-inducible protein A, partial [Planctomycetota bacterium]